jgi:hypothetical protein
MNKNKVISDWLDKYNDPEIDKKVKMKLEEITKEISNQIIDEVYENYFNVFEKEWIKQYDPILGDFNHEGRPITQEEFINKCKTDPEFSEKWGLKIEERELNQGERQSILEQKGSVYQGVLRSKAKEYKTSKKIFEVIDQTCDEFNIPTKLITITYNDKKIEIYE